MATELTGGSEAVLALARQLRHAISGRQEMIQRALDAYDHAVDDRLDRAANFLRAVQRADSAYESSSQEALECFHERIEGGEGL
jgi:hypothetical protein